MTKLGSRWLGVAVVGLGAMMARAHEHRTEFVKVFWNFELSKARTTASLQVVVNPLLRRDSVEHDAMFGALSELHADMVRFVPWMPYPRLGVAELQAPSDKQTFWDFTLIDPLVEDFMNATQGKNCILNFSTIPQWLFDTPGEVGYPDSPNEEVWNYEQGTELRDSSMGQLASYYRRLYQWYASGGFVDELGVRRPSLHKYDLKLWEVFNEPDAEHLMTPEQYTARYDAVVQAIKPLNPEMQFMGPALERPMERPDYFEYFLNPAHHAAGVKVDWLSYHFYATAAVGETLDSQEQTLFAQADKFLDNVRAIEAIKQRLSPETKTAINEVGTMMAEDYSRSYHPIAPGYWSLSAAVYAYLVGQLTLEGIELVSQSQLVGFPGQFPSVSMLDWDTGQANPRYWVLKLIIDHVHTGAAQVKALTLGPDLFALAFLDPDGARKILLVNKKQAPVSVQIADMVSGSLDFVSAHVPAIGHQDIAGSSVGLDGWEVGVVTLK